MEIKLIDDLRERKLADAWIEDFVDTAKKQWADFTFKLPTGESLQEVQDRNIAALNRILKRSKRQDSSHWHTWHSTVNPYQLLSA